MQLWRLRVAGLADIANDGADSHLLALGDDDVAGVGIGGQRTIRVAEDDHVAVIANVLADEGDFTGLRGVDWRTFGGGDGDTGWVGAKILRDFTIHRPLPASDLRCCGCSGLGLDRLGLYGSCRFHGCLRRLRRRRQVRARDGSYFHRLADRRVTEAGCVGRCPIAPVIIVATFIDTGDRLLLRTGREHDGGQDHQKCDSGNAHGNLFFTLVAGSSD